MALGSSRWWSKLAKGWGPLEPDDPRVERICRALALLAGLWFALAAFWEIGGLIAAGHWAAGAARGIIAENMWHWGIGWPVREYTLAEPSLRQAYANHPWGTFWLTALGYEIVGRHDLVCRLPAVLMSASAPPLLYGIGRMLWGPVGGALAACGYAVLPIALGFANFNGFEGAVIFGALLTSWATLRFARSWQRRWMALSLLGILWCAHADWIAYVFCAVALGGWMLTAVVLPRGWFTPRVAHLRRYAAWWALGVGILAVSLLFYVWIHHRSGALCGVLAQAKARAGGSGTSLGAVLAARKYWLEACFTPLGILLGGLALPVFLFRLLVMRRALEIFPLAILTAATVHYLGFKRGADVHIYWSQLYAPYLALSLGLLGASLAGGLRRLGYRLRGRELPLLGPLAGLAAGGAAVLAILPDGIDGLVYARRTGGRFDEKGRIIHQDADKNTALRWLAPRLARRTVVLHHSSMKPDWAQLWSLHRPTRQTAQLPTSPSEGSDRYLVADARFVFGAKQKALANGFAVTAVGPFWLVDRGREKAPAEGYALEPHEPSPWQWYWLHGADPIYRVRPDAFLTWELRHHYGQEPNPEPSAPPETLEQLRVAHNLAISRNDAEAADGRRAALEAKLARLAVRYDDGTVLLGTHLERGVAPRLGTYFLAAGPSPNELQFAIRSRVIAAKRCSLVGADPKERTVGIPFALPPSLWRPGYLYASHTEIRSRPGRERFYGAFYSRNGGAVPKPVTGPTKVTLLEYP